ncbi:hypothetical protein D9615_007483 [Tricholomella constricta]|uniref:Uncharacterized protein n=1 Tax=Tricholomella constricta TaxID=117010 RepID=A0A8H5GYI2_9AGAR|nr:hypothetical protein D9615_007483 [Tricholomella constricta]
MVKMWWSRGFLECDKHILPPTRATRASMEGLRQVLDRLRTEAEKGIVRRKDADAKNKILANKLKEKDKELDIIHQRLDLTRQSIALATKWDATRRTLEQYTEKITGANAKVEQCSEKLELLERERDEFEARYVDVQARRKALEAQLDGLL